MYHSNSSAVPGYELPSEAECSHDWRGIIDWKNSSCWWNQGENYCGKSSSLVSVYHPQERALGCAQWWQGQPEGLLLELGEADFIPCTGWKSLQENMGILAVSWCEERDGTPGCVPGQLCWPSLILSRLVELKVTVSFNWLSELSPLAD